MTRQSKRGEGTLARKKKLESTVAAARKTHKRECRDVVRVRAGAARRPGGPAAQRLPVEEAEERLARVKLERGEAELSLQKKRVRIMPRASEVARCAQVLGILETTGVRPPTEKQEESIKLERERAAAGWHERKALQRKIDRLGTEVSDLRGELRKVRKTPTRPVPATVRCPEGTVPHPVWPDDPDMCRAPGSIRGVVRRIRNAGIDYDAALATAASRGVPVHQQLEEMGFVMRQYVKKRK